MANGEMNNERDNSNMPSGSGRSGHLVALQGRPAQARRLRMNNTLVPMIMLVAGILFVEGCHFIKKKRKRPTLHNYPVLSDEDCPVDTTSYDEDKIRKRAKELGMRPVDYLHYINNQKRIKNVEPGSDKTHEFFRRIEEK